MKDYKNYLKKKYLVKDDLNVNKAITFSKLYKSSFFDYSYIKKKIAPMGWNWLYFSDNYSTETLGEDGHVKSALVFPKFYGCKRMFAGSELLFFDKVILNNKASKISQITCIENKSKEKKKIYFVTIKNVFKVRNKKVLVEYQKIVYINKSYKSKTKKIEKFCEYKIISQTHFSFNNIHLFRYSAITYNSHRIHYDLDYTRKKEGYENLLVHGPLLASFSLEYLSLAKKTKSIKSFSFKIIKPVFVNEKITLKLYYSLKDEKKIKTVITNKLKELKFIGTCILK